MKKYLYFLFFTSQLLIAQSKITVQTNYSDVKIYAMAGDSKIEPAVGLGSAEIKLKRKDPNRYLFEKTGFESVIKEFPRTRKWPKSVTVNINTRVFELVVQPINAQIYVGGDLISENKANIKIPNGQIATVEIKKEGYKTIKKLFYNQEGKDAPLLKEQITLTDKIVEVVAMPFDAKIYLDGNFIGNKVAYITIPEGRLATIEIKKNGFRTIKKTYFNEEGKDVPPIKEEFKLLDKIVDVKIAPLDGVIYVDKIKRGIGSAQVIIPYNKCVMVQATKEGYTSAERVFCNKENDIKPPTNFSFLLEDRLVKINTSPKETEILLNGKVVGLSNYNLKIPKGKCIEVNFSNEGYIGSKKNYCNSTSYQEPPVTDFIELAEDDAYATSVSTDLANVKFTIVVREGMSEIDAWKVLSQIITTEFDVLEVIDKETGYLRTAWQIQAFNNRSTIRTRVIVSLNDSNPLKYAIKISSERADGIVSAKEDEKFSEWNRILKKYKNIIEEAQTRL